MATSVILVRWHSHYTQSYLFPQSSSLHSEYLRDRLHIVDVGYRTMKQYHSLLWITQG